MNTESNDLAPLVGRKVVLDTAGTITFLGILERVCTDGFWLTEADIRDRTEGHVTKERYVCEARESGIKVNRRRLFVFSHVVISLSALDDVTLD